MRGEKEVTAIFKKPRISKKQAASATIGNAGDASDEDEETDDQLPEEDDWHELPDSSDEEVGRSVIRSDPGPITKLGASRRTAPALPYSEPVIEDSDWDDAEILA